MGCNAENPATFLPGTKLQSHTGGFQIGEMCSGKHKDEAPTAEADVSHQVLTSVYTKAITG